MATDPNCRNVEQNIKAVEGKNAFVVFWRLTEWGVECLYRKMKDSREFPVDQEQILFENIEYRVKDLKPGLIVYDLKDLKRLGRILEEYLPGTDAAFNKELMSGLQNACYSIYNTAREELKKSKNKNSDERNDMLETEWKEHMFEATGQLAEYNPTLNNQMEAYLKLQMDVNSLFKIKLQIGKFFEDFVYASEDQPMFDRAEYDLALERVFQVAGEQLKKINLSQEIRESLEYKGLPVEALAKFRDMISHFQLFPMIKTTYKDKEELERRWKEVEELLEKEIIELEGNYLHDFIVEKTESHRQSEVKEMLAECVIRTVACLLEKFNEKIEEGNPWDSKALEEIKLHADRLKSTKIPERTATEINRQDVRGIKNAFEDFIISSKKNLYDNIYTEMNRRQGNNVGSQAAHENDMEIMKVRNILTSGGTVNKVSLENFINQLDDLHVSKANAAINVKKELKKYFDANEIEKDLVWDSLSDQRLSELRGLLKGYGKPGRAVEKYLIEINKNQQGGWMNFTPKEFKAAVEELKKMPLETKQELLSVSIEWKKNECAKLLGYYFSDLMPLYDAILGTGAKNPKGKESEARVKEIVKDLLPTTVGLYKDRMKIAIADAVPLENPSAVASKILNVLELWKRGYTLSGSKRKPSSQDVRDVQACMEEDILKFRNYLGHGDELVSGEKEAEIAKALVDMKDDMKVELLKVVEQGDIHLGSVSNLVNEMYPVGLQAIKGILCPGEGLSSKRRRGREVEGCLKWEDIEEVTGSKEGGTFDPENIKVDSEKMMNVLEKEIHISEEKFANYLTLSGENEIKGRSRSDLNQVVRFGKTHVRHLENVKKFSGAAMHAMMAKNIVGDILKGDYEDVAVNVGFIAGSYALGDISKIAARNGARFAKEGRLFVGGSLKLASPLLSRGISLFIAYDLWNQIQALKSGDKDAIVGVFGDGILLTVDAVEVGIMYAEGMGMIGQVSAVTGPIGMAIGATVFVGTEIYKAVKEVEKIDDFIHLTGPEKFNEGLRAFFGISPSNLITNVMEVKQGNNALVENAKNILISNTYIRKYVFPSFIQIGCYDPMIALNSSVRLASKVNLMEWSRTSPDDVPEVNVFCKPKGSGEPVPKGWGYYCENAIGVEYNKDRTSNYTLIQMGKGDTYVEGFQESGNIFIINQYNKTLIGGGKDDSFKFHFDPNPVYIKKKDSCRDPIFNIPPLGLTHWLVNYSGGKIYDNMMNITLDTPGSEMVGIINGAGGTDTIDVEGIRNATDPPYKMVVADFPRMSLNYSNLVAFNVTNVEIFLGSTRKPDRVVAACSTALIDGRGGYNEQFQDLIYLPNMNCSYNTTITVNPHTNVTNDALNGNFQYFIRGNISTTADINLQKTSKSKNTFIIQYGIHDLAAIEKADDKVTFSFVKEYYGGIDTIERDNSFNLTVSKQSEGRDTYLLTDNTEIVVGKREVYVIQNTDRTIDSVIEVYGDLGANLNAYLVVHSKNEVLTIAGSLNNVFTNDPTSKTTHFVSRAGENIFKIISGRDRLRFDEFPLNEVMIHYFTEDDALDTLDLRQIKQQMYDDYGMRMLVKVSRVLNDLKVHLFVYYRDGRGGTKTVEMLKITLKNVLEYFWFKKIQVVMETIYSIEESDGDFRLVTQPLVLDNPSDTLFVINPSDVSIGSRIKIPKKLRNYTFARKDRALIITNSLNDDSHFHPLVTVVLNEFYRNYMTCNHETGHYECNWYNYDQKMASLSIEFDDNIIAFSQDMDSLSKAGDFILLKEKYESASYRGLLETLKINRLKLDKISNQWVNPLAYATIEGNATAARELIKYDGITKIAQKDIYGHSPLYYAVKYQREDMFEDFLRTMSRTDINALPSIITSELPVVDYIIRKNEAGNEFDLLNGFGKNLSDSAFETGNPEVVGYLIEKVEKDNSISGDRKSYFLANALDAAVKYNHSSVFDYVIQTIRAKGLVPLSFVIKYGTPVAEKYLIENKGTDIYEKDKYGKTPLFYAFQKSDRRGLQGSRDNLIRTIKKEGDGQVFAYPIITGDVSVMQSLMKMTEMKGLINEKNYLGSTPLHYAAMYGRLEMAKMLIDGGAQASLGLIDDSSRTPLACAIKNQHAQVVEYFSNDRKDDYSLVLAATAGKARLVKGLAKDKADLNRTWFNHNTLLHYAAGGGSLELVRYLLEKGLDPGAENNERETPLHVASSNGYLHIVKALVLAKADANVRDIYGETPLSNAIQNQKTQVIIYLCEATGKDALFVASKAGATLTVKFLVENGADIHKTDDKKQSLLHLAVESGELALVKYLANGGIDPNVMNEKKQTPLHYVAMYERLEIGEYLIKKGANANAQDELGWTPIFWTINKYNDNINMLQLFINNGADLKVRDKLGRTPLRMAEGHDPNSYFTQYLKRKIRESWRRRRRRQVSPEQNQSPLRRSAMASDNVLLGSNNHTLPPIASWSSLGFLKWANNLLRYKAKNTTNSPSQIGTQIDSNGAIMLLDLLIRKYTRQNYVGTTADETPLEIQARALNVVQVFEETLNNAALQFGVDARDLNLDPVELQSAVIRQLRNGKTSEILKTLNYFARKACTESRQREHIVGHVMARLVGNSKLEEESG